MHHRQCGAPATLGTHHPAAQLRSRAAAGCPAGEQARLVNPLAERRKVGALRGGVGMKKPPLR